MRTFVRLVVVAAFLCLAPAAWSESTDSGSAPAGEPAASSGAKSLANGIYMGGRFLATYGAGYSSVTINLDQIYNTSAYSTGTLRLTYWATTSYPARGQGFTGYRLATFSTFSPLLSGYYYYNIVRSSSMLLPPDGTYWLILALEEYSPAYCSDPSGFCMQDSFISDAQRTFGILPTTYTLNVSVSGLGGGGVSSTPAGISCPGVCSENYVANTLVTLYATPTAGSVFAGWSGGCSGTGACTVMMSKSIFITATFTLDPLGDADGDGIPNGVELSLGRNPFAKDNDVFTNANLFAMQQYRDFLNREGDAGGIASWTSFINGGGTRATVVEDFVTSAEFQGVISPVTRLYFAYFLRIPDYNGLQFWINYFRAGNPLATISNAFAGSGEFTSRYGALANAQFVDLVYQNVLGRPADAGGKAFWLGQLNGGMTRGAMMIGFSESPEYVAAVRSEVNVTMTYIGMLRRAPDTSGFTFWVGYLDQGNSQQALISGFLAAPEYRNRFLP